MNFNCTYCRLTDNRGNILNPYSRDALFYTVISSNLYGILTVAVQGYITVFIGDQCCSEPMPFCFLKDIPLKAPKTACLDFITEDFQSQLVCCGSKGKSTPEFKIEIAISCTAQSYQNSVLTVPSINTALQILEPVRICTRRVLDCVAFPVAGCLEFNPLIRTTVAQYIAFSDGQKRIYTDQDASPDYPNSHIPAPESVSLYYLYVNGVLQPESNYLLAEGLLQFKTTDLPSKDTTIVLSFVTFHPVAYPTLSVTSSQYISMSDGIKRIYTNADGLQEYNSSEILSPQSISYCNLYINGELQPHNNYSIEEGKLLLQSANLPPHGAVITLEMVVVRNPSGKLLCGQVYHYVALSNGGKIYTDEDAAKEYCSCGIPNTQTTSYQNLYVNGVIQPYQNYWVHEGILSLNTTSAPLMQAPIMLQSVNLYELIKLPCNEGATY